MTDATTAPTPQAAPAPAPAKRSAFRFTDDGCLSELRFGALLVLAGTFLWNFVGPTWAMRVAMVGAPFLLVGVVMQAIAARRGIPGMPWKLGLAMLVLGAAMCVDFRFRDQPGGPLSVVLVGPILAGSGVWILLWLLPASMWLRAARAAESA